MLKGRDVHAAGLVQRIYAIVQGDKPDVPLWKVNLGVLPAEDIVAAQPGQVFDDDQIDLSLFDVLNHPLKPRPLKIDT